MPKREEHSDLKQHVDEQAIRAAIETAERETGGEIHVSLAKHVRGTTQSVGARVFRHLGYATRESVAVLFFVVPARRELAVVGSAAIHARLGERYWQELVEAMVKRVQDENLTAALVYGIREVGRELARLAPRTGSS